jgi:hypothetical protein
LGFEGRFGERTEAVDFEQLAQRGLAERDRVGDEVGAKPAPRHAHASDLGQALDHGIMGLHGVGG